MFDHVFSDSDSDNIVASQLGAFVIVYGAQLSLCNSMLSCFIGILYVLLGESSFITIVAAMVGWVLAYVLQRP